MTKDDCKDIEHLFDRSKPIPSQDPRDYDTFDDWYNHLRLFGEDGSINHAVLLGECALRVFYMNIRNTPKSPEGNYNGLVMSNDIKEGTKIETRTDIGYFDIDMADDLIPYEDRMRFEKLRNAVPRRSSEYRKLFPHPPYKIIFKEK